MRLLHRCVLLAIMLWINALSSQAQELPIVDAHIHYSQPDWEAYTPELILRDPRYRRGASGAGIEYP